MVSLLDSSRKALFSRCAVSDEEHSEDDDFFINSPASKRRRTSRVSKTDNRNLGHTLTLDDRARVPIGWKPLRTTKLGFESGSDTDESDRMSDFALDAFSEAHSIDEDDDSQSSTSRRAIPEWRSKAYLLLGPSGIGKTSMVYALAHDLGFKVFELNPSTRRSGKDLSDQFQVALDSHHVAKEHLLHTFSTFHMTSPKGLNLSCNSLVLLDEVDVLFDSDRGFWNGLDNLLQLGRRPIILTASDPAIIHELPISARVCRVKPPDKVSILGHLSPFVYCGMTGFAFRVPGLRFQATVSELAPNQYPG
ncbi:unnamed protein product [Echinostoma caproni]|uniref:AAA domain-containing protein n=1 Tax=Echinostoma caproni TaxID=27848 RepID=A0A183AYN6_9TREM|nr:unnamed protein product [Echinostoma caproni]